MYQQFSVFTIEDVYVTIGSTRGRTDWGFTMFWQLDRVSIEARITTTKDEMSIEFGDLQLAFYLQQIRCPSFTTPT